METTGAPPQTPPHPTSLTPLSTLLIGFSQGLAGFLGARAGVQFSRPVRPVQGVLDRLVFGKHLHCPGVSPSVVCAHSVYTL